MSKLYLSDTYLFECDAKITATGTDEKGPYVLLDRTVFYPQGGGQPCDLGTLGASDVMMVKQVGEEVRHYCNGAAPGAQVRLVINGARRLANARHHTASHLMAGIVNGLYASLVAVKGHAFPGEAYVEFQGECEVNLELLEQAMNAAVDAALPAVIFDSTPEKFEREFYKLPYEIPGGKEFRVLRIGDYPPVPCGGTHLKNTSEIGRVKIKKISAKNGGVKVSFEIS
ncbi:MAG: alanyl-tRNA editing protein [Alphaproteobacteria bacterium]|nr:alanyl-tRNA editing protein [Alphaproteobacteria bacterium]